MQSNGMRWNIDYQNELNESKLNVMKGYEMRKLHEWLWFWNVLHTLKKVI